jgi:ATP-dependent DNA helicase RecQ
LGESEDWRTAHIADLRAAYLSAYALADRLGLLRSLVRVARGWLGAENFDPLTPAEWILRDRLGLAVDGGGVRLKLDEIAPELRGALRLDSELRRAFEPAPADAVLLRFSDYDSYQSETQKAALRALLTAPSGASLAVSMPTIAGGLCDEPSQVRSGLRRNCGGIALGH